AAGSCVHCNVQLTQPGSMTVRPGESLTISCKVSGYSLTDSNRATGWIRQPVGKEMEWVGSIGYDGSTAYKESLKNKFTIFRDTSSSTVSLQGKSLQTEDTAVYYFCITVIWAYAFEYWGKGTKVTVGAKLPSYIYPLHQCGSADSRGDISLGCIASGFSPLDALSFKWSDGNGNVLPDFHQYSPVMVSGSTMMVSHITVKAADWNSQKSYRCAAHHQNLGLEKSETLQKPDLSCRPCLDVTLKPPRVKEMFIDNRAVLECIISGEDEAVKEAEVTWMLDSVQVTDKITQTGTEKADHLFRKSSILTLAVKDWEGGKTVTCSVQLKGGPTITKTLNFGQKGDIQTCKNNSPIFSIQTPSPEDLNGKSEFFLLCLVTGFYPEEIYIMWQVDGGQYEEGITGEPLKTGDKYSVTSLFMVSKENWDKGTKYNCNARHVSQKGAEIPALKSMSKSKGNSLECPV
uniref:Ig-like domain-containing protein n=1 Tax=Paramormyrops kingsleyae TaxID=1676925 RepID=A0A3B3QX53_9TELE